MNVPRGLIEEMIAGGEYHPYGLRGVAAILKEKGATERMVDRVLWYADQLEALSQEEPSDVSHGA